MRVLIERPFGYTKRQLSDRYGVHLDTISHDFDAFRAAGFILEKDSNHRYGFAEDKVYKELSHLLHFAEEEQILLEQAIDQISPHTKIGDRLKRKLGSLYDYRMLGHSYLRKPYLTKVDMLMKAQKKKKSVKLVDYQSSHSNVISDRWIEPFHTSPPDDMLHAFDIRKKALRHFRISRFKRVELLDESWVYEKQHIVLPTDPFRIVDAQQVMVHIRFKVAALNELTERYPMSKMHIMETEEPDVFDFQGKVNHRFLGLLNFILGNYHFMVEVVEPVGLVEALEETVKEMRF
ncbi:MAG: WYL domain-containing protein [Bacteroidota bacterium]